MAVASVRPEPDAYDAHSATAVIAAPTVSTGASTRRRRCAAVSTGAVWPRRTAVTSNAATVHQKPTTRLAVTTSLGRCQPAAMTPMPATVAQTTSTGARTNFICDGAANNAAHAAAMAIVAWPDGSELPYAPQPLARSGRAITSFDDADDHRQRRDDEDVVRADVLGRAQHGVGRGRRGDHGRLIRVLTGRREDAHQDGHRYGRQLNARQLQVAHVAVHTVTSLSSSVHRTKPIL